jgi:hypothetical protein
MVHNEWNSVLIIGDNEHELCHTLTNHGRQSGGIDVGEDGSGKSTYCGKIS